MSSSDNQILRLKISCYSRSSAKVLLELSEISKLLSDLFIEACGLYSPRSRSENLFSFAYNLDLEFNPCTQEEGYGPHVLIQLLCDVDFIIPRSTRSRSVFQSRFMPTQYSYRSGILRLLLAGSEVAIRVHFYHESPSSFNDASRKYRVVLDHD
ncbi:hypothetical protein J6590_034278 [Homalodisca vitripennis]|nr:hypothetical protein J6590_034278 [Homalodisca vitripennis]